MIKIDYITIALATILAAIGIVVQYSAADGCFNPWASRQIAFTIVGLITSLFLCRSAKKWAYPSYYLSLLLLAAVIILGDTKMGATRWLSIGSLSVQPSELAKLTLILALALYMDNMHLSKNSPASFYIVPFLICALPVLLVFAQPHLGHSTIMLATGMMMILVAGFPIRIAIWASCLALASTPVLWFFLLKNYQKTRIISFLHPERDPLGAGYNVIQSEIAAGSGGIFGKGILAGTQTHLGFLPEKHTDFIFTIIAEETGLIGCMIVLAIYFSLFTRIIRKALNMQDKFLKLSSFGIAFGLFIQTLMNICMTLGLMPVVGVPLPLISYGGSSLIASLLSVGIASLREVPRRKDFTATPLLQPD